MRNINKKEKWKEREKEREKREVFTLLKENEYHY